MVGKRGPERKSRMNDSFVLRLTGDQHTQLRSHLFPGDGNEAVALALCGRLNHAHGHALCVYQILLVPHSQCRERTPERVTWDTSIGRDLFQKAAEKGMGILKIHSHPEGYKRFSKYDDRSDKELFSSLHSWTDDGMPHASVVMLPDGSMFGRIVDPDGNFQPISKISVVGDDILFFREQSGRPVDQAQIRTSQTFGDKTTSLLKQLRIGIVGCSGTGSWVAEQLARLGVEDLLLVDPDIVEEKNLNRIVNSTEDDALNARAKVLSLQDAISRHGTKTKVSVWKETLFSLEVAAALATCDIIFGCMDSIEGRDTLNRIATFYTIPYFDLGVRLDADGAGGIQNVSGAVHYLIPGGSSLLSRGVYTSEGLRADSLKRTNPEQYKCEAKEGYIKGAKVESPAVISVNGFCASMAVNEFLARIHPYRLSPQSEARWQQFDLVNSFWQQADEGGRCPVLSKHSGRGDMNPFLNSMSYA